jgi:hypothetical protein
MSYRGRSSVHTSSLCICQHYAYLALPMRDKGSALTFTGYDLYHALRLFLLLLKSTYLRCIRTFTSVLKICITLRLIPLNV